MKYSIPYQVMNRLTETVERNIYTHSNPLVRWIFWQRIEVLGKMLSESLDAGSYGLDFGGGSGSLMRCWHENPWTVDIVDLAAADAVRLREYLGCSEVTIVEASIADHEGQQPYDFIVAADVLEHFPDLDFPLANIRRLLKPNGKLFVSLPTENRLYDVGRLLIRKSKPADHYHSSAQVFKALSTEGFTLQHRIQVPRLLGLGLPVFDIGCLVLGDACSASEGLFRR